MKINKYRIGFIVPSSNTTIETEIPAMLKKRQEIIKDEFFTFHSSRMRMKTVSKEELKKMDSDSERCAIELSDANCNVIAYACLIAIMSQGTGYHYVSEKRLEETTRENGSFAPVASSAGALVYALKTLKAKKVAIIAPYLKPLTKLVIEYLNSEGIQVIDSISLEEPDNLKVGKLNPDNLIGISEKLNIKDADAVILSSCVQMQSLSAIDTVEKNLGIPVISAATSTVYQILKKLNLETIVPNAGSLLSGKY